MELIFRENKNQYLMSFLSVLVDLQIFREIYLDFMLVGHTGNQVLLGVSFIIIIISN